MYRIAPLFLVLGFACAHKKASAPPTDLATVAKRKAAFELGCAETELTVTELSDSSVSRNQKKTFGIEGCGRRASYLASCIQPPGHPEQCDALQISTPLESSSTAPAPETP